MKNHTRVYLTYFNYDESDFICCEVCKKKAIDIHHLSARGMGGSKLKDTIENLMALCRACHDMYGDKKQYREFLIQIHKIFMQAHDN